jgi:hypothetical protein
MKDILFIIEGKDKKKIKQLEKRIQEISKSADISVISSTKNQLYYDLEEVKCLGKSPKFVCLLNEDMTLSDHILDFYNEYSINAERTIYLPLVVLKNEKVTGVLNNCLWNSNLAVEVGYLDNQLALKQIDTTLYGALIPYECFINEEYYNKDIEYYQHFYFLNKYADKEDNLIVGIPKILYNTSIDLSFEGVDNETKIKNFKLAREINITNENKLKAV